MFVGVAEDALLWNTAPAVAVARDLGVSSFRISFKWQPGVTALPARERAWLTRAVMSAAGMRIVVAVYGHGTPPPADDAQRAQYCGFVRSILEAYPQINDVVIWNEPNLSAFWRPQFGADGSSAAPAAYVALVARCWDDLHAFRPSVNVVAPATSLWGNDNPNAFDNVSHSPATFIRRMGDAYRASGRTQPLFDTLGHHPYPSASNERPWKPHPGDAQLSVGDLGALLDALSDAFGGTPQPLPEAGLPIWYLETGYQTTIDPSKIAVYLGTENWPGPVPDLDPNAADSGPDGPAPDQATQLLDVLRLSYCQPYVKAIFNFLLWDEGRLEGWQSGVLWADGSRKRSYGAYQRAIASVRNGNIDCDAVARAVAAAGGTMVGRPAASATATPVVRAVTKVSFAAARRAPYGFAQVRAKLTRGVVASSARLQKRQLTFTVRGESYVTLTDGSGTAAVPLTPPLAPGGHRVSVRFGGDEEHLGSGVRVTVRVVNSKGRVSTRGKIRIGKGLAASVSARSSRGRVRGSLVLTTRTGTVRVRLTALGLPTTGKRAWLAGRGRGGRYVVHVDDRPGRRRDRLRVWRRETLLNGSGLVAAGSVRVQR